MNGASNSHRGDFWRNHSAGQLHLDDNAAAYDDDMVKQVTNDVKENPRVKFQSVGCHSLEDSLDGPEDLLMKPEMVRAREVLREHLASPTHYSHREAEGQRFNMIC